MQKHTAHLHSVFVVTDSIVNPPASYVKHKDMFLGVEMSCEIILQSQYYSHYFIWISRCYRCINTDCEKGTEGCHLTALLVTTQLPYPAHVTSMCTPTCACPHLPVCVCVIRLSLITLLLSPHSLVFSDLWLCKSTSTPPDITNYSLHLIPSAFCLRFKAALILRGSEPKPNELPT